MSDKKYGLYKRIMKRDPKAIDDIKTLEEAKEIIKMVTGNVHLNGEVYQMEQELVESNMELLSGNRQKDNIALVGGISNNGIKTQPIQVGSKIFCEGQRACFKLEEELNNKGIKTRVNCNEVGMWSVFIESVPCGVGEISVYDGCGLMDFETCQHRKDVYVMGIKKRSLFCDFDDMECNESNGKCRNQDKF